LSSIADDAYNKLRKNIGNDFGTRTQSNKPIKELFSFHCGSCGYKNIHDIAELKCGCGKELKGVRVYQKIEDTVVYDSRNKKVKRR
jgi:hypothetical protein